MRILIATDGSPCSEAAVKELCSRPWPPDTEVKVVSVAHTPFPLVYDPFLVVAASYVESMEEERKRAAERVARAARHIRENAPDLRVTAEALEGSPKKVIVAQAEQWPADLILVGSHGYGPVKQFLLGSVSHAVALHAPCSVEIVRGRHPQPEQQEQGEELPGRNRSQVDNQ
jgi:nucleotide-binding universal stress UspA family protein